MLVPIFLASSVLVFVSLAVISHVWYEWGERQKSEGHVCSCTQISSLFQGRNREEAKKRVKLRRQLPCSRCGRPEMK